MKNKNIWLIVLAVVLLCVGLFEILFFSRGGKKKDSTPSSIDSLYILAPEEEDSSMTYTSPTLSAVHCLNSICIENASFHYDDESGRIEYTIENQSSEKASGVMKMVFGSQSLMVVYQDLVPGSKVQTGSYYRGKKIESMEDYILEPLTAEEQSKIVYSQE